MGGTDDPQPKAVVAGGTGDFAESDGVASLSILDNGHDFDLVVV